MPSIDTQIAEIINEAAVARRNKVRTMLTKMGKDALDAVADHYDIDPDAFDQKTDLAGHLSGVIVTALKESRGDVLDLLPVGLRMIQHAEGSAEYAALQAEGLRQLQAPFAQVEKLTKTWTDDHGNRKSFELDYVGHALVTERLNQVDPLWQWEPHVVDDNGRPVMTQKDGGGLEMWGTLTIVGITRPGVGTVRRGQPEASKEMIGDMIRNAAMRFGVALDLWNRLDRVEQERDSHRQTVEADSISERNRATARAKQQVLRIVGFQPGEGVADDVMLGNAEHLWARALSAVSLDPAADIGPGDIDRVTKQARRIWSSEQSPTDQRETEQTVPKVGSETPDDPPDDGEAELSEAMHRAWIEARDGKDFGMLDASARQTVGDKTTYQRLLTQLSISEPLTDQTHVVLVGAYKDMQAPFDETGGLDDDATHEETDEA